MRFVVAVVVLLFCCFVVVFLFVGGIVIVLLVVVGDNCVVFVAFYHMHECARVKIRPLLVFWVSHRVRSLASHHVRSP